MNKMKEISIEKVTINFGAGKDQVLLEKGIKLLKKLTDLEPVKTITKKRIPSWSLRPGLPIGCKITIRDQKKIKDLVERCLKARNNKLPISCFDNNGNISWGIHEYIDVPGLDYDPEIGIIGFQICITLERPGFRIKRRSKAKKNIGIKHLIRQEDSIKFMSEKFGTVIEEEK